MGVWNNVRYSVTQQYGSRMAVVCTAAVLFPTETNDHPQAFLWIPSDCTQVKAVIIGNHNMTEETLFENSLFRERLSETGIALIWITPGWDQRWDITTGCQEAL